MPAAWCIFQVRTFAACISNSSMETRATVFCREPVQLQKSSRHDTLHIMPARAQAQAQAEAPLAPVEQKPSRYMGCNKGMHPHMQQHIQLQYKPADDKPDADMQVDGRSAISLAVAAMFRTGTLCHTTCNRRCVSVNILGNERMLHVVGNSVKGVVQCQHNQANHTVQDAEEHHMGHSRLWLGACGTGMMHMLTKRSCCQLSNTSDNRLPKE